MSTAELKFGKEKSQTITLNVPKAFNTETNVSVPAHHDVIPGEQTGYDGNVRIRLKKGSDSMPCEHANPPSRISFW